MIAEVMTAAVLWIVPPPPSPMPVVHDQVCPGFAFDSCFIDGPAGGDLYLAPILMDEFKPEVREHELGHAYDHHQLVDGERVAIEKAMGWRVWHKEAFAWFYAGCRLAEDPRYSHRYGPWRGLKSVAARCRLLARAGL